MQSTLKQAMLLLEQVDKDIAAALLSRSAEEIDKDLGGLLRDQLALVRKDETGLAKRRIKQHLLFLLDRCAEKLLDLTQLGETLDDDRMRVLDRAAHFAAQITNVDSEEEESILVTQFGTRVKASTLDPVSPEEHQRRKDRVKAKFSKIILPR